MSVWKINVILPFYLFIYVFLFFTVCFPKRCVFPLKSVVSGGGWIEVMLVSRQRLFHY